MNGPIVFFGRRLVNVCPLMCPDSVTIVLLMHRMHPSPRLARAPLSERNLRNEKVRGSSPLSSTTLILL
jgi:hypothetical protein